MFHKLNKKFDIFRRFTSLIIVGILVIPSQMAQAQTVASLPQPGVMVPLSPVFHPALIRGMKISPEDPFRFDFIIDAGNSELNGKSLEKESSKLIKYFLAALTVPEKDLWVNLSPYEKDRIIAPDFGRTEMGRDLLAQDYLLKQITASLVYPEEDLGKTFWDKVYKKAHQLYETTEVPVNTFNKVWIVPEKAVVYVIENNVFVAESHLKVMIEEDYLALEHNSLNSQIGTDQLKKDDVEKLSDVSSSIVREIIIPEIEKEVNSGKNFANLRQIYNSVILATWFKKNLKDSLIGKVYANQNKTGGIDLNDQKANQKIYQRYLDAFEKGVYDYIREDYDPSTQQLIPRKYFSGGAKLDTAEVLDSVVSDAGNEATSKPGMFAKIKRKLQGPAFIVSTLLGLCTSSGCTFIQPGELPDKPGVVHQIDQTEENLERSMDLAYFANRFAKFVTTEYKRESKKKSELGQALEAAREISEELVRAVEEFAEAVGKTDEEGVEQRRKALELINEGFLSKVGYHLGDIQDSKGEPTALIRAGKQILFRKDFSERMTMELKAPGFVRSGSAIDILMNEDIEISFPESPTLGQLANLRGWKSMFLVHLGDKTHSVPYQIIDYNYKEAEGTLYFTFEIMPEEDFVEREEEFKIDPGDDEELKKIVKEMEEMRAETKMLRDYFAKLTKERNKITGKVVFENLATGLARLKYMGMINTRFPAVNIDSGMTWSHEELRDLKRRDVMEGGVRDRLIGNMERELSKEHKYFDFRFFGLVPKSLATKGFSDSYKSRVANLIMDELFGRVSKALEKEVKEIEKATLDDLRAKYAIARSAFFEQAAKESLEREGNYRAGKYLGKYLVEHAKTEKEAEDIRRKNPNTLRKEYAAAIPKEVMEEIERVSAREAEEFTDETIRKYLISNIKMRWALDEFKGQEVDKGPNKNMRRLVKSRIVSNQKRVEGIDGIITKLKNELKERSIAIIPSTIRYLSTLANGEYKSAHAFGAHRDMQKLDNNAIDEEFERKYGVDVDTIPDDYYKWSNEMGMRVVQWLVERLESEQSQLQQMNETFRSQIEGGSKTGKAVEKVETPGGIDLNPNNFEIQSYGDKIELKIPADFKNFDSTPINGFTPVILQITPITNLPLLLGESENESREVNLSKLH